MSYDYKKSAYNIVESIDESYRFCAVYKETGLCNNCSLACTKTIIKGYLIKENGETNWQKTAYNVFEALKNDLAKPIDIEQFLLEERE